MKDILIFPNNILRQKALPVEKISNEEIKLSKKMIKIMTEAPGIGLAAPQLGKLLRIITINAKDPETEKDNFSTLFNPEIMWYSKKKIIMEEGCLSIPHQFADIERPEKISLKYVDNSNKIVEKEVEGIEARVIQHEVDHLEGKLFIDYLSSLKRNIIIKKLKKLVKKGEI